MRWFLMRAATALMLILVAPAEAVPLTTEFSYLRDEDGGQSLDADVSIAPTDRLTLHGGAGHSRGSTRTSDLSGTLLSGGASWRAGRGGAALSWDSFDDSSNYQADTLGARAWLNAGDFEFALLGRRRDVSVDVTLELPLRTVRRELDFAGTGAGLEVSWSGDTFSAYVMAVEYDYDADFDRFIDLIRSPQLAQRPRIEALLGSVVTQTQGAIDRQAGVGCEFSLGRQSVGLDLSYVHDALLDSDSRSLALTYRRAQTAHVDWGLSAGLVSSEAFGDVGFLGVEIGLAN